MLALLPLLILMNLIRNLKFLAPFSMIANVLIGTGMGITFYYILHDLPSISERPVFSSIEKLPLFFGTAIFALEGVGVVSIYTFGVYHAHSLQKIENCAKVKLSSIFKDSEGLQHLLLFNLFFFKVSLLLIQYILIFNMFCFK